MKNIKNFIVILCVSLLSIVASAQTAGVKPLTFVAVEKGDVSQLKALIQTGANVNEVYEGVSLLNKACGGLLKADNDIIKVLLDAPKINVKTITITNPGYDKDMATTPLVALLSSSSNSSKIDNVVRLIKMGVDINYHSEFNNKFDALIVATFGKQTEESKAVTMAILNNASVKLNVNYMGKYDASGYLDAVQSQHAEAVEAILKRGAKVEGVSPAESWNGMIPETIGQENHDILDIIMKYGANKYGPSSGSMLPLNMAMVDAKQSNWADYFITKYKVDVNHLGKAGLAGDEPAINDAAFFNNVEGLKILVKNGANINLATSQGINAIQKAAQRNSLDAAKYLIQQKTNLKGYNSTYFNAISYAAVGYHLEMLDLLVKSGADVNEVSKDSPWAGPLARTAMGFNPLDKKARLKTLSKLLELGANPNVLHAQDMTAIMCAAKLGSDYGWKAAVDNCEVLIKSGANVNLANTAGETALMLASEAGNSKLVALLIKSGAEVNAVNKVNDSALSYANRAQENKSDIVKALENAGAKPVVASAKPAMKSVPGSLVGTWKGYQTDDKTMMATFVVNKNNTYSYAAVGKVNGTAVSYSHKGEIVASEDTYTLKPEGKASATYSYKIVNGKLSVNNGRPLDKVK
ncbi:MAG TPA: ankyrin repeat domain-containing protein [Prolixibacteraceae bacterium]|nr:ankyrin repeat domain-containing protein [Prolixibacteraceae bacterium]